MKKIIFGALFGAAFLITGTISLSTVQNAQASSRTGKWIDVYGGGSTPSYAYCSATFWRKQCMSGDKKNLQIT